MTSIPSMNTFNNRALACGFSLVCFRSVWVMDRWPITLLNSLFSVTYYLELRNAINIHTISYFILFAIKGQFGCLSIIE